MKESREEFHRVHVLGGNNKSSGLKTLKLTIQAL